MKIIFFGSTTDSLLILEKLTGLPAGEAGIMAVVTQPPKPVGRKKIITPTPVETWANQRRVPVFTQPPRESFDLIISASYGEKIPIELIRSATYGGLNVHPSLLPRWRGGDPVPWAILTGDRNIGVSIVTLTEKFDQGLILAQKKIHVTNTDMTDPLRAKLFTMGADLLIKTLPGIISGKIKGTPQKTEGAPYARRLTRDDGFEPWETLFDPKESERINRKYRAFHPWPGLWTIFKEKRVKILNFDTAPTIVQLEGKKPVSWQQFRSAHLPS